MPAIDSEEIVRFCRDDFDAALSIALLYRIVLGRAADEPGFAHYAAAVRSGKSLSWVARQLLESDEYRGRRSGDPWWRQACENAGEPEARPRILQTRAGFCCELASRASVRRRMSLPSLDLKHFDFWREIQRRNEDSLPVADPAGKARLTFVVVVGEPLLPNLSEMCRSLIAGFEDAELLLLTAPALEDRVRQEVATVEGRCPSICILGTDGQVEALAGARGDFVIPLSDLCVVDPAVATDLASPSLQEAAIVSFDQEEEQAGGAVRPLLAGVWDPERAFTTLPRSPFAIRRDLVARLRLRLPADPSVAEWDLIARGAGSVPQAAIFHVPRIRRRRLLAGTTASMPTNTQMAEEARRLFHDSGQKSEAIVAAGAAGYVRVVHPLPEPAPLVSIIIPSRNHADLLKTCLTGITDRTDYPAMELIVVDNGSDDADALQFLEDLARRPRFKILREPGPFNWARLNNLAALEAEGDILVFLNNDIDVIHPDWLRELASQATRAEIGAAGAKLLYADGTVQHAGLAMTPCGDAYHAWRGSSDVDEGYMARLAATGSVSAVTGACLATRSEVWRRVGGFDERLPITYSDVDYCFRVRSAGLRVIYAPGARLLHLESATRGSDNLARLAEEAAIFKAAWGSWCAQEPWLGPHIDAEGPLPRLRPAAAEQLQRVVCQSARNFETSYCLTEECYPVAEDAAWADDGMRLPSQLARAEGLWAGRRAFDSQRRPPTREA